MDIKQQIIEELDSRLERLHEHRNDIKKNNGNEYEQLNHAVSRVIGATLTKELEDIKGFIEELK